MTVLLSNRLSVQAKDGLDKTISAKYIQQLVICDKLFKSQVLKGISLTGGVQHCNSKANLWLAKLMKQDSGKSSRAELPLTT